MKFSKVILSVLVVLLAVSTVDAQNWWKNRIKGEGDIEERKLDVPDFDGFTLAISANVKVRQGNTREIVVKAQPNIIDNIELKMQGDHLKITYDRPVWRSKGITIYMTVPSLDAVAVSGSGKVEGEGTFTNLEDLAFGVSGSGRINLNFEAQRVKASVSGSGHLNLMGTGEKFNASVSGSGGIKAADLRVAEAEVSVSGSGNIYIHATDYLDARVSGSGDVKYKGTPRLKAKTSGSGDIESI